MLSLQAVGLLEPLELTIYDQGLRIRPTGAPDPRIVLITETEADLKRLGYPLPDAVLADALQWLNQAGVQVIGINKFRNRPIPPGVEQLAAAALSNVFWIMQFGTDAKKRVTSPPFLNGLDQVGFADFPVDVDGVVRRALLFLDDGQTVYTSMALQLTLHYLRSKGITPQPGFPNPEHLRLGSTTIPPLEATTGGYHRANVAGYQYLLDFHGMATPFVTYTVSELINGQVPESALRGRIILIGTFADSLKDHLYIPPVRQDYGGFRPGIRSDLAGSTGSKSRARCQPVAAFRSGGNAPHADFKRWTGRAVVLAVVLARRWFGLWASSLWRFGGELTLALAGLALMDLAALAQNLWLPAGAAGLGLVAAAGTVIAYLSLQETP